MNMPTSMTRFIGTPRNAAVLYVGIGCAVLGWMGGAVPWWIGLIALANSGTVARAMRQVKAYDAWASDWRAMGNTPHAATSRPGTKPSFRMRHKNAPPWVGVMIAALSLLLIPVVMTAPGMDAALRQALTLMWCGMALYLLWKLGVKLRRSVVGTAGAASAGRKQKQNAPDVVEWVLPRASSSPSRADAVQRLPEYAARLLQ